MKLAVIYISNPGALTCIFLLLMLVKPARKQEMILITIGKMKGQ